MNEQVGLASGSGVGLSGFRKYHEIPKSTFYRAVKVLVDEQLLYKHQRDSYAIHEGLINTLMQLRMKYDDEIQMELGF